MQPADARPVNSWTYESQAVFIEVDPGGNAHMDTLLESLVPRIKAQHPTANQEAQFYALCVLAFVRDLLQSSPVQYWRREELISLLSLVMCHEELFHPGVQALYRAIEQAAPHPPGFRPPVGDA
jgi:hypothetical protein